MSNVRGAIIGLVLLLASAFPLAADVLTFDDVPGADPLTSDNPIPDGYGGFNWDQVYVLHKSY